MFEDGLVYRDSRMAEKDEFIEDMKQVQIDNTTKKWKGGPILYRDGKQLFIDDSDTHTLIVGDTGSMKTLRYVLPMIYSCAMGGESMVVVDPKGELAKKMAPFLKTKNYQTHIINLRSPQYSPDQWNPMARIQQLYYGDTMDRENAVLQLNDLLNTLFFMRSESDRDRYWNEMAGQLAFGICELMEAIGEDLTIDNLLKWRYERLEDGTLEKYYHALHRSSTIYQNLSGYMALKADTTKTCILSTFDQLVRVFKASSALTKLMSQSSFDIKDIGTKKMAVFLVVPDEKTTFHFLATLFISQCYELLLEEAEQYHGALPQKINFILEEFCNMPKLEDIIPMLTAARSRNIRFHLVIQSYEQMVEKYGDHISKTILDNCGNLILLHSRELSFLQYVSDLSGNNEYGRPLLSVSRMQRLKKNETIIFHDRCYPFVVQDIPLIFEYPINTELLPQVNHTRVLDPIEEMLVKPKKYRNKPK